LGNTQGEVLDGTGYYELTMVFKGQDRHCKLDRGIGFPYRTDMDFRNYSLASFTGDQ
jgi:hypothetical protein